MRVTDQVVEAIKTWISTGELRAGDRLPRESELIDILGCSRGTIRESLKILESQGIIDISPGVGGGARIRAVSYRHANEFLRNYFHFQTVTWDSVYEVRELLEPLVAIKAVGMLSSDVICELEETISQCEAGISGKITSQEHRAAELGFHSILARICPDPLLGFLGSFINDLLLDFGDVEEVVGQEDSEFASAALAFHKELLRAYKDNDRQKVFDLMSAHMHDARCIVNSANNKVRGDFLAAKHV